MSEINVKELQAERDTLAAKLAEPVNARLLAAARAVVARWETPLWKDAPATAGFIYELRDAIAAAESATAEPLISPAANESVNQRLLEAQQERLLQDMHDASREAALDQARAEEREACAAIIQDAATAAANNNDLRGYELLSALGRAIRARGQE